MAEQDREQLEHDMRPLRRVAAAHEKSASGLDRRRLARAVQSAALNCLSRSSIPARPSAEKDELASRTALLTRPAAVQPIPAPPAPGTARLRPRSRLAWPRASPQRELGQLQVHLGRHLLRVRQDRRRRLRIDLAHGSFLRRSLATSLATGRRARVRRWRRGGELIE